ncbi:MAG TPA: PHP domain-containing protein, partial [Myxococcota bacterium]|nr:PHP domain-containing protein [Myxococcota bacterium]
MLNDYVELRASSAYSFLRAASNPEDLVETAAGLGLGAMALADADGVYGIPRFVKACRQSGIRPICGARIKIQTGSTHEAGGTDIQGDDATCDGRVRIQRSADSRSPELLLLCRDRAGWQNLCELITA